MINMVLCFTEQGLESFLAIWLLGILYSDKRKSGMFYTVIQSIIFIMIVSLNTECKNCLFKQLCLNHSYEQAYEKYGSFNWKNPYCKIKGD